MAGTRLLLDDHELVSSSSFDSKDSFNLDDADFESHSFTSGLSPADPTFLNRFISFISLPGQHGSLQKPRIPRSLRSRRKPATCRLRRYNLRQRKVLFVAHVVFGMLFALVFLTFCFRPSYTHPPKHYVQRREAILGSQTPGRGNPKNEKLFIAASLFDPKGEVVGGSWGQHVQELIGILGPSNVYLSVYENGSGDKGKNALRNFADRIQCNKSIVYEEHMDLQDVPTVILADGTELVKRIAYLAEVRNRALRPLDGKEEMPIFDKLLYLNDVSFDPIDAVQLLFSTNVDSQGVARYRAACSVDFINAFKFYDTYATRDLEGFSMGVPFYPWFTNAGKGESRCDVLDQVDAVRVRSCWGGMVAFDAAYFQRMGPVNNDTAKDVVRFRAENELYWEASECCLVHADIQLPPFKSREPVSTGIYLNPYIRVAYDDGVLRWLSFTRRFERLYSIVHWGINKIAGMPRYNPRRLENEGETVQETIWVPGQKSEGEWSVEERTAGAGGFCGKRSLQVMIPNPQPGQKNWQSFRLPS